MTKGFHFLEYREGAICRSSPIHVGWMHLWEIRMPTLPRIRRHVIGTSGVSPGTATERGGSAAKTTALPPRIRSMGNDEVYLRADSDLSATLQTQMRACAVGLVLAGSGRACTITRMSLSNSLEASHQLSAKATASTLASFPAHILPRNPQIFLSKGDSS